MGVKEQGFTIIELLLVLLGAVLFSSIGLSAHKVSDRMKLSMAAREIQTLIRQTQDQAYGEQADHMVAFYTKSGKCLQVRTRKALREVVIPKGIKIDDTTFLGGQGKLYFNGKLAPSGGGSIVLTSKAHLVEITVLPVTGRVKIKPIIKK